MTEPNLPLPPPRDPASGQALPAATAPPLPAAAAPPVPLPAAAAPPVPLPAATAPGWGAPGYGTRLIAERKAGPGLLLRALWFVLVGWWLTGIVATVAWLAMITIIGLPLGIWLVNRVPTALTLRPRTSYVYATTDAYGRTTFTESAMDQPPWWARGLWFIFVGWWASAVVMGAGYVLCLLIITLPVGLLLFNRVPFVASLYRY